MRSSFNTDTGDGPDAQCHSDPATRHRAQRDRASGPIAASRMSELRKSSSAASQIRTNQRSYHPRPGWSFARCSTLHGGPMRRINPALVAQQLERSPRHHPSSGIRATNRLRRGRRGSAIGQAVTVIKGLDSNCWTLRARRATRYAGPHPFSALPRSGRFPYYRKEPRVQGVMTELEPALRDRVATLLERATWLGCR